MCPGMRRKPYWAIEDISIRLEVSVDNVNQMLSQGVLRPARLDHPSGRAYWLASDLEAVRTLK